MIRITRKDLEKLIGDPDKPRKPDESHHSPVYLADVTCSRCKRTRRTMTRPYSRWQVCPHCGGRGGIVREVREGAA